MMNNKIQTKIYLLLFIVLISVFLTAAETEIVFDSAFFKEFNFKQTIEKDDYFESILNKIIIGRGRIVSVSLNERYKKKYRIVIESSDSSPYNQKILFFVFLENKNTADILTTDSNFEFKGQLMGYTPLGTKRNEYILDVVFMDGSTVIE
jgi:hypothetical protein